MEVTWKDLKFLVIEAGWNMIVQNGAIVSI